MADRSTWSRPSLAADSFVRLFVGVPLDKDEARRIAQFARHAGLRPPVWKVSDPTTLHWTIRFLGEMEESRLAAIQAAVAEAARVSEAFEIGYGDLAGLPSQARARVAAIVPTAGEARLKGVHAALDRALACAAVPAEERPFRPHLTVARASKMPAAVPKAALCHRQRVDQVILWESRLGAPHAIHTAVSSFALVKAGLPRAHPEV